MIAVGIQGGDSNNIKKEIYIECPYVQTNTAFANAINLLERFSVSAKEIPTFKAISYDIEPVTFYIELLGIGKGTYGIGGIVLKATDVKVTGIPSTAKEIVSLSSTQIIDLGYTSINAIDSINSQVPALAIQDQTLGYVLITGFFENDVYKEYLWIGQAGTYGGAGALQATEVDLKPFSGVSNSQDQNNFSRVIKISPSNLSGSGTVEEQICVYINSLAHYKQDTDSDIWIEIDTELTATPVACVVSEWSAWSDCRINGTQTRTRSVIIPASNGGTYCPVLYESRQCIYTGMYPFNFSLSKSSIAASCALTDYPQMFWCQDNPIIVGSVVYETDESTELEGANLWYHIQGTGSAYRIGALGEVIAISNC